MRRGKSACASRARPAAAYWSPAELGPFSLHLGDPGHPFSYGANELIKIQDLLDELMEAEVD